MRAYSSKSLGCGCLGLVLGFLFIVVFAASAYLLNFALKPDKNKGRDNYDGQYAVMKARYPWIAPWVDSLLHAHAIRDTFITAGDGTNRHAVLINPPHSGLEKGWDAAHSVAVLVPGYTDCAINMLHAGYIYNKVLGMGLVIPDLYANGRSDGKAMQMGWKDREDVVRWIDIAGNLYKDTAGHARIVVHGQSMGAATVMNVSGMTLGDDVKCFVEDCGYTSAWDEFSYELNDMFGLPDFPLLYTASALCKLKYGWSFGEASPLRQIAKCEKPMLFIHGGNDTFVPTRMVYSLYAAKPSPKYLVVFHGSRHARSYCDHRQAYEQKIKDFVMRCLIKHGK